MYYIKIKGGTNGLQIDEEMLIASVNSVIIPKVGEFIEGYFEGSRQQFLVTEVVRLIEDLDTGYMSNRDIPRAEEDFIVYCISTGYYSLKKKLDYATMNSIILDRVIDRLLDEEYIDDDTYSEFYRDAKRKLEEERRKQERD